MGFPKIRMRRLRSSETMRRLVRETSLSVDDLVYPLFVREGTGIKQPIKSMAGSVWDTAPYDNLGPLAGTEEAVIEQKLNDIMIKRFAEMVNAQSPEQLDQIYERMMQELEANDAEAIEAIYSKNYSARMDLWY